MRCPVCRTRFEATRDGELPRCVPCATIVRHVNDDRDRLLLGYNAAGKLCFQARATHRLDDVGPGRAHAGMESPMDVWLPGGHSPTLVKANRP